MNYLTFKLVIAEDHGAKIFQKLAEYWNSTKRLDENYFGPEFYWAFFQLGDFTMEEMAIVKWEIWSQYRLRGNFEDLNKSAYIGVTCGLFIYYPQNPDSYKKLKESTNLYFEKRKSDLASSFSVLAIVEKDESEIPDEHKNFIEANGGNINILTESFLEKNIQEIIIFTFISFLKELRPEFCKSLEIKKNFWSLTLPELRAILMADRQGIQLISRHLAPLEEKLIEKEVEEDEEELIEEELESVAISPEGEVIPISKEITPSEIVELLKKGYKLPDWVVIPRHCPRCYNQNQHSIREVEDKTVVLMEYPRIYGMKFVCGNCGNEWREK